ncbi:hypothetical protein EZS27_025324 [termite gut metagenome]|uniref:Uncharacterized protein n=1 Tax=termite gut metagenome TaxID=433724 RepID=A0A5J4QVC7_9ZZZZ
MAFACNKDMKNTLVIHGNVKVSFFVRESTKLYKNCAFLLY